MANRGGYRPNSGRKKKQHPKKKVQIYIDEELEKRINSVTIGKVNSVSSKICTLISKGIDSMLKEDNNVIRFADLFAGMGGIRLGFDRALKRHGLVGKPVFVSEIKKSAITVYKSNFGNEQITGDITKVDEEDIPDLDYILAGFPCQAFSTAGKQLGFEDTRGTLFFDVARIIRAKKPKGFILENVEGLTTHDHGKTFKVITNTLHELGYSIAYKVLNSADFGLAQKRKRIYIIGNRLGKEMSLDTLSEKEYPTVNLSEIIEEDVPPVKDEFADKLLSHYTLREIEGKQIKDKRGGTNNIHSWDFELKGAVSNDQKELLERLLKQRRNKKWAEIIGIDWMDGMPLTASMISTFYNHPQLQSMLDDLTEKGYLSYEYPKAKVGNRRIPDETKEKGYNIIAGKLSFEYTKILSPCEPTPTLVATDMSHLGVPVAGGIRPLTTREGLRLFGYPETYSLDSVSKPKAYDLLGNTVAVNVIEAVADVLIDATE
ncbi:DNA (cytosine-5-)-methyltransferase [Lactobacillus delbrueckii subsp. bulgaricus]|jgi:DNA (cytosine-5)-methyltransferase 1